MTDEIQLQPYSCLKVKTEKVSETTFFTASPCLNMTQPTLMLCVFWLQFLFADNFYQLLLKQFVIHGFSTVGLYQTEEPLMIILHPMGQNY